MYRMTQALLLQFNFARFGPKGCQIKAISHGPYVISPKMGNAFIKNSLRMTAAVWAT